MKYEVQTVAAYLDAIPEDRKPQLEQIISLIKKYLPGVQESLMYHMPSYSLDNPVFHLASQKHYMAIYVNDHSLVEKYKKALGKVSTGKCCIRFKRTIDLDMEVLEELIKEGGNQ